MPSYEAVIGLEVHVQARTESKMFCSCPNKYGAEPNTLVCPVCMGYPGVLPKPNMEAIRKIVTTGLLCNCEIRKKSKFDRKSYFYPDSPKNYQLTQYDMPFCLGGHVHISGKGFSGAELPDRDIHLTRIHMEEDVGKLTHFGTHSGVDYNRAGVPLMEIVSEPDMHTPDEAYAYLTALKQIIQYANISDCDMEKGQMRADVNVSIREKGSTSFGAKVELKNLNSFRAVHRSLAYEIKRQVMAVESGEKIEQETRGWNDDLGESYVMRGKENAHDYRYFPEPDMLPVIFTDEDIENFKKDLPELPAAKRERFVRDFKVTQYDAQVLTQEKACADYFEEVTKSCADPKIAANWIIVELPGKLAEAGKDFADCPVKAADLAELVNLIHKGTINGKIAKTVFAEMFESGKTPAKIVEEKGLVQVSDESAILAFVEQAIANNPTQVQQYKEGNPKVLQFLIGQVMKLSKGKANPQSVAKLLAEKLS